MQKIELRKAIDLGVNKSYVAAAMGQALLLQEKYQKVIDTITVADNDKGKMAADIYNVRGDALVSVFRLSATNWRARCWEIRLIRPLNESSSVFTV